jgi:hydroxyethylthiazole kinase-like sugar kinase family protein
VTGSLAPDVGGEQLVVVTRRVWILLASLTLLAGAVVTGPDPSALVGAVLAVTAAALVVAAVAVAVAEPAARAAVVGITDRQARERARRGAFRRQTAPTTDGRPRPRAPGRV